ncbi:hypothetical protein RHMOL_Rhmol07G0237800 [Rhododendron molle]|uniref:Uncharacterized protein n=1 Tax=Rhododendron molle TaxID=49168 RepID=A0ACC0N4A2_RHOML|nr:hypothetical protein RHMOL_Rhmol07G0237800 [Rhododendron molle]
MAWHLPIFLPLLTRGKKLCIFCPLRPQLRGEIWKKGRKVVPPVLVPLEFTFAQVQTTWCSLRCRKCRSKCRLFLLCIQVA